MGPHCDLDLEDRNPNILHNTPGHDNAPTYYVLWYEMLSGSEDIIQTNIPRGFDPQCDLDLEDSNKKLSHKIMTRDGVPLYQIWLQKVQKFMRYGRNFIQDLTPYCDLDLEDRTPTFLHDTLGHDDAQPYQVSCRKVKWWRR